MNIEYNREIQMEFKDKYDLYQELFDKIPFYAAACLAGQDTPEANKLRKEFLEKGEYRGVAQGLAGLTSPEYQDMRKELLDEAPESVARSLAGIDESWAWDLRRKLFDNYLNKEGVSEGLAESVVCLDTDDAWKFRNNLLEKKGKEIVLNIFEGLMGVDDDKSWALRNKFKKIYPFAVAYSLAGLKGKKVDTFIKELLQTEEGKKGLILANIGKDDDVAFEMRNENLEKYPFLVGTSLAGVEGTRAESIRKRLLRMSKEEDDEEKRNQIYKGLLQGVDSNYIFEAMKMQNIKF